MTFTSFSQTGINPVINISRAANGWLVEVHHMNRERDVSPESLQKRKDDENRRLAEQKEREKKRIMRDMKLQITNMAIIGEAAGKAQHRAIDEEVESWKTDTDEEDISETLEQKIEKMAEKIASESPAPDYTFLGSPLGGLISPAVETHLFTDRAKMVEFVNSMLQPIVE